MPTLTRTFTVVAAAAPAGAVVDPGPNGAQSDWWDAGGGTVDGVPTGTGSSPIVIDVQAFPTPPGGPATVTVGVECRDAFGGAGTTVSDVTYSVTAPGTQPFTIPYGQSCQITLQGVPNFTASVANVVSIACEITEQGRSCDPPGGRSTFSFVYSGPPLAASIDVEKSINGQDADTQADAVVLTLGDAVNWEYVITNTGDFPLEAVSLSDDNLPAGTSIACPVDLATYTLAAGESVTCTASGTATDAEHLNTATVNAEYQHDKLVEVLSDADPAWYVASAPAGPALEVSKTASSATVSAGDTVTYTVTATNTGGADYTTEDPAVIVDDLSGVLDDAAYNDDAAASVGSAPTVSGSTLTWQGPLAAGETVTLTYSVTVGGPGDGDGTLRNAVIADVATWTCPAACTVDTVLVLPPIVDQLPVAVVG